MGYRPRRPVRGVHLLPAPNHPADVLPPPAIITGPPASATDAERWAAQFVRAHPTYGPMALAQRGPDFLRTAGVADLRAEADRLGIDQGRLLAAVREATVALAAEAEAATPKVGALADTLRTYHGLPRGESETITYRRRPSPPRDRRPPPPQAVCVCCATPLVAGACPDELGCPVGGRLQPAPDYRPAPRLAAAMTERRFLPSLRTLGRVSGSAAGLGACVAALAGASNLAGGLLGAAGALLLAEAVRLLEARR